MRLLALNLLVIFIIASPLILIELLRYRSNWIDKYHEGLIAAAWLLTIAAVYIWVLPMLGLAPNWRSLAP